MRSAYDQEQICRPVRTVRRKYWASNPHAKLLDMASGKARRVPTKLIEASADSIPLDDSSVDTVVTTCTLCTIPDVAKARAKVERDSGMISNGVPDNLVRDSGTK